jgi:hypothetical protein
MHVENRPKLEVMKGKISRTQTAAPRVFAQKITETQQVLTGGRYGTVRHRVFYTTVDETLVNVHNRTLITTVDFFCRGAGAGRPTPRA